jgi:hypothetical protein
MFRERVERVMGSMATFITTACSVGPGGRARKAGEATVLAEVLTPYYSTPHKRMLGVAPVHVQLPKPGSHINGFGRGVPPAALSVFLCCLVLWTSTPASAHFLNHHDRDDVPGGMDLSSVHLWSFPQDGLFSLVVQTYDPIGRGRFKGWFDSFGDSRWDYALVIPATGGCRMVARVGGPHTAIFAARVDETRAHCLFQVHSRFRRTKHIRLRVWADGANGVRDKAPDAGWFRH